MSRSKNKGKVKATRVRDEKGRPAGWHVEDSEGRVAAVATPQPIKAKMRISDR